MVNEAFKFEDALRLAEVETERVISSSARLSRYRFSKVVFARESEWFWIFVAGSKELQDEGIVPGAIHVCIDKKDGHIWSGEEMENFFLARAEASKQAVKPDSAAA